MKKWSVPCLLASSFMAAAPAMADFTRIGYQTDSHHIIVEITNQNGHVPKNGYTYLVWNKPNSPYERDAPLPAWKIGKGSYINLAKTCSGKEKYALHFKKGDTVIDLVTGDRSCFHNLPADALGELIVHVKGREKARYWLYEGD